MTTPKPSTLSEQELNWLEDQIGVWQEAMRIHLVPQVNHHDLFQRVLRLIAQARAARPSPTCATCVHYREQRPGEPAETITCMKFGSPAVRPAPHFGCILHEPSPPAQDGGRP